MSPGLKKLLAPLASLKLTVVLLVLCMILVYAGTWAQLDTGVWEVQHKYFHSFFTWISFYIFLPRPKPGQWRVPGGFPMLGGYTVGLLLLINLLSAHFVRFKLQWKRSGIILIHLGLILLLVGEGITSGAAVESQMPIPVGGSANYSMDTRSTELAIIDPTPADHDDVAVIPGSMLKTGADVRHSALPVDIHIDEYFRNTGFLGPMQAGKHDARATAGTGVGITPVAASPATGVGDDTTDYPSAFVTLSSAGQPIGTYLLSTTTPQMPGLALNNPQAFQVNGKTYFIQLRFKRLYKPYTVRLLSFHHGLYAGTDTPKDFSSYIQLVDPSRNVDREVRIWMNNPLRYHGETFYQAGFPPGDGGTILQVVSNPAWLMPYFACAIGALGLLIHFGIKLIAFLRRAMKKPTEEVEVGRWDGLIGVASILFVIGVYAIALVTILSPVEPSSPYNLKSFGLVPVAYEGRPQPLDSLARNSLRLLSNHDTTAVNNQRMSAIHWLADMFADPKKAADYPVIRIDNKEVTSFLGLDDAKKYFTFHEILKNRDKLQDQFNRLQSTNKADYDTFQRKIAELGNKLTLYIKLGELQSLFLLPPAKPGGDWQPLEKGLKETPTDTQAVTPAAQSVLDILKSYHDHDASAFNAAVSAHGAAFEKDLPVVARKVHAEATFNHVDPFTQCIVLYIAAFLLICIGWLGFFRPLRKAALLAIFIAAVIHTAGLAARIYISGRPPVTNLASSAIFIAWGIMLLSVGLELIYRNGVGAACAALLGFLSLLIADRLALDGDTMAVLQAVLDTNYWLATHVVVITLGYAATFLAGFLGITYVVGAVFTNFFEKETAKDVARMIYGIVCFAMLFSFVGTILGGIWADQSWGRFWGWDPKENGAVLIVLSNALLLHARWGGMIKERGMACMAIFGNIVTSWSWFGVNMLGVGLHSYGFMERALVWLLFFDITQVALIILANLPIFAWRKSSAPSGSARLPVAHRPSQIANP